MTRSIPSIRSKWTCGSSTQWAMAPRRNGIRPGRREVQTVGEQVLCSVLYENNIFMSTGIVDNERNHEPEKHSYECKL